MAGDGMSDTSTPAVAAAGKGGGDVVSVQKFGGSSMASPERIRKVAMRVAEQHWAGRQVAVVVSAMGDTTDDLIAAMRRLDGDPDPRELDQLMATGEMVATSLTAAALHDLGVPATSFNAFNLGIETDSRFGAATIRRFRQLDRLRACLAAGRVAVVAGFQGIDADGDLTTLGRGGSDITAVALARELGLAKCEKYTDEDGVYTSDPRIVPTARKLPVIDYDEMMTLADFGAGIVHPRAIEYAREAGIAIHVRSSFISAGGSVITAGATESQGGPTGLTGDSRYVAASICGGRRHGGPASGWPAGWLALAPAPAGPCGSTEPAEATIVAFRQEEAYEGMIRVWQVAAEADADEVIGFGRVMLVSLVGRRFAADTAAPGRVISSLQRHGIPPLAVDRTALRVSAVVHPADGDRSMQVLHREFIEVGR